MMMFITIFTERGEEGSHQKGGKGNPHVTLFCGVIQEDAEGGNSS